MYKTTLTRPLTYQDVYDLCERLDILVTEFESFYGHHIRRCPRKTVITKQNLDHIVRFLMEYPEYSPFKSISFDDVKNFFKKHVVSEGISLDHIPALLGRNGKSYIASKAKSQYLKKQMRSKFLTYKPFIEKHGVKAALKLLSYSKIFNQLHKSNTQDDENTE